VALQAEAAVEEKSVQTFGKDSLSRLLSLLYFSQVCRCHKSCSSVAKLVALRLISAVHCVLCSNYSLWVVVAWSGIDLHGPHLHSTQAVTVTVGKMCCPCLVRIHQ
jgi:hypothetical protein